MWISSPTGATTARTRPPRIDDLAGHVCDAAKVIKVDVDAARKLAEEHGISGLPTVAVFRNGKVVKRSEGYQPAGSFLKMLEESEPKG